MPTLDQLTAFVAAAETGSFSAASRQLNKAQSAISTAINNLEIETNLELFDRSVRKPKLTADGQALLSYANAVLLSSREFSAHASSLIEQKENRLCLAVEQSIPIQTILPALGEFEQRFPFIEVELLDPGAHDVASLVRTDRADIGMMLEQEEYPEGYHFRSMGHYRVLPVCGRNHALVAEQPISLSKLRHHRQLVIQGRHRDSRGHERQSISPKFWLSESPFIVLSLLCAGIGWAFLPETVVQEKVDDGELVILDLDYLGADIRQGLDLVWSQQRALGEAGTWLLTRLLNLEIDPKKN
jgi:DNA-binding transcriptional LysR family regulator